ncbi:OmpA/MotB family protein [Psychrobacter celer]|uniref:OmpA/MotB family protein n=1 Tax=Psychrobacter celer TaxID=306572 RepID=UPI003FD67633
MSRNSDHWIPLADLMTGLMMMFMLVAVLYMLKVNSAVSDYSTAKDELGEELCNEFANDLDKWDAECDQSDLVIRFKSPDVLFDTGKSVIKPQFKNILSDFFPRYTKLLKQDAYRDSIEEIRIEGHTSSSWGQGVSKNEAYFQNMQLSQARTLSVLKFVLSEKDASDQAWTKNLLTANGLSSSKLILDSDGTENEQGSQRVEFRVRTNADEHINKIIDDLGQK